MYALGGYCNGRCLDSIEGIALPCITNENKHWTTLKCTLSTPRGGCQAAPVHNRFIVVVGGNNGFCLSSTDIIDTAVPTQHIVSAGPSMTVPRFVCGMAVVGRRIFVTGGYNGNSASKSVEYLEFMKSSPENNEDVSFIFPSSSKWKVHKDLVLSVPRQKHAVAKVGTCLIVTGGDTDKTVKSVEVLDTTRNVVFHIPDMTVARYAPSVVSLSDCIVVIGGYEETCEALEVIDMQENTRVRC